ncbi:hypothetical protein [Limnoglobus roseus]|uniref:Uncharacterized protein n=1 Tax=Limnoglobus roseus TaxID=2598579 RepID=A0A5C1AK25_9BACT|nr:hypothetical protein [Limnoglobus roseus]QEL19025.1 hypothetical protein PX52LOC_06079 [Limnoglobus roseus]
MARKPQKTSKSQIVAFKVEEELAEFLDNLPNKSDFIRKAILAQFGMTCPLCVGTGVVARGVHDHFKPVIEHQNQKPCEKCKTPVSFPMNADGLSGGEKKRIEQFLHGGPLYCLKCYPTIPPCDDCGWHVPMEKVAEHFKRQHTHA